MRGRRWPRAADLQALLSSSTGNSKTRNTSVRDARCGVSAEANRRVDGATSASGAREYRPERRQNHRYPDSRSSLRRHSPAERKSRPCASIRPPRNPASRLGLRRFFRPPDTYVVKQRDLPLDIVERFPGPIAVLQGTESRRDVGPRLPGSRARVVLGGLRGQDDAQVPDHEHRVPVTRPAHQVLLSHPEADTRKC